ncbi:FimV/HubP family polar landmark protein [Alteromonas sediminis]
MSVGIGFPGITPSGNGAFAQESVPIKGPKSATDQFSGAVYGPITSSDTLWRIAERYRQNNTLSIYQVMVAIYELNPDAFEKQNLNLMVDGAMLQLPSERFIARIDAEKAKKRAEQDDNNWERAQQQPGDPKENLKPPSPLVNQEDLAITKTALEDKLNTLDASQAAQFELLREQFALSIDSVETLLQDNQKLYERIDKVNTDLDALRSKVESDVQTQMQEQSGQINEILSLMRQEQQQREEKEAASIMTLLSSPTALIAISALLTVSLIGGIGAWLLKRNPSKAQDTDTTTVTESAEKAMDLSTADDLADTSLGGDDDLSDDDLFNDDDLLDDVLSSELEESLDDELESFADLSDEMLVPDQSESGDSSEDSLFEEGESELDQDDLDSLFEEDTLAEDLESGDGIDISMQDEELLDNLSQESDSELLDEMLEDDEIDDIANVAQDGETTENLLDEGGTEGADETVTVDAIEPAEDAPEIDIDDLLEENAETPNIAEKLGVDENNLDEEMLSKIDDEIQQQGQELDQLTDNIIGEIEQLEMMGGMLDELDDSDEEAIEVPEDGSHGPQDLDALAEDLEDIQVDDMANAEDFADPLSDELLAELQNDDADDLTEELLQELEPEPDDVAEAPKDESDALADELLEELEQSPDPLDDLSDELLAELDDAGDSEPQAEEDSDTPDDALSDDVLDELESTPQAEEDSETLDEALSDDVLDELESTPQAEEDSETLDEALSDDVLDELESTPQAKEDNDTLDDALSDDVLDELEGTPQAEEDSDTLDDALSDDVLDELESTPQAEEDNDTLDDALSDDVLDELESTPQAEEDSDTLDDALSDDVLDELESTPQAEEDNDTLDDALSDDVLDELESTPQAEDDSETLDEQDAASQNDHEIDDSILENVDDFSLEQEQDGVLPEEEKPAKKEVKEAAEDISDVPGIDDWLSENSDSTDTAILDELENTDFDELLNSIDEPTPEIEEAQEKPKLDNPDLDLDALLNDFDDIGADLSGDAISEDFVSVESLIDEADQDDSPLPQDDFDLDVSLDEFTGALADNDMIDVDLDASQAANLDLARAYIDMDDFSAARGLLNEVLEHGNEGQIEEAKALLQELGDA